MHCKWTSKITASSEKITASGKYPPCDAHVDTGREVDFVVNFFNDPCSKHTTNAGAAARSTLARLEMSFLRATSLRRTRFLLTPALLTAGLRCTTPRPKPLTIQKAVTTCKKKNNGRSTPGCLRLNLKNKKKQRTIHPG